jgi:hypothetical protein
MTHLLGCDVLVELKRLTARTTRIRSIATHRTPAVRRAN